MRKFLIKLLLFVAIFLVFDKLFIFLVHHSAASEADRRLEYVLDGDMNKDIIIIGSSTGSRDIIASQIQEATGLSTYNLCYPGSNIQFHEFILKTLVKFNQSPEIAVLVVDDNWEFTHEDALIFRKDRLYPLIKYPYIWNELSELDSRDKLFSHFLILNRIYKYNLNIKQKKFTPLDTIMDCGSMPISWKPRNKKFEYISEERPYLLVEELPEKLTAFNNIIDICKTNNIELVVVSPPVFKKPSRIFEERVRTLSGDDVYIYIYNKENPTYSKKENYYDVHHLMKGAAIEFTAELIAYLEYLLDNEINIKK